jgi:hypothetical protein
MQRIAQEGQGALIYLHQTSKGFRWRSWRSGPRSRFIVKNGCRRCRTVNARPSVKLVSGADSLRPEFAADPAVDQPSSKVAGLEGFDIEIVEQIPVPLERRAGIKQEPIVARVLCGLCLKGF